MKVTKFKFKEEPDKPTSFKFNNIGDKIQGKFVKYAENKRFKNVYYLILNNNEGSFIISCPKNLQWKMQQLVDNNKVDNDTTLIIEYVENQQVAKYSNPKKIFNIYKVEE